MREKVINVEPQKVITKDNVTGTVDAVVYYKEIDPVRAEGTRAAIERASSRSLASIR